jgi:GH24 family phage-related lysozyme (muramidase)
MKTYIKDFKSFNLINESLAEDPEFREKVKEWEGKVTDASGLHVSYDDATMKPVKSATQVQGVMTIGYGTTKSVYPALKPGMKISEKEAERLLTQGIQKIEDDVRRRVPGYDKYPKYVQIAIMNASYRGDLGPATIKLINAGKWSQVSKEYLNHPNYTNPGNMRGVVARMKSNADAFDQYAKEQTPAKSASTTGSDHGEQYITVGKTLYPRKTSEHDFANVRNEPIINGGLVDNIIATIKWPNPVGVAKYSKTDDKLMTWYYVELPKNISLAHDHGWVRFDAVTIDKNSKFV